MKFRVVSALILLFPLILFAARPVVIIDQPGARAILPQELFDIAEHARSYTTAITSDEGLEWLQCNGISYQILHGDINSHLAPRRRALAADSCYHTYDEVVAELNQYVQDYPSITKLESIGTSWEKRDILALKISDNPDADEDEPAIMYVGMHHAREWIAVEVPMAIIDTLLKAYGNNQKLTDLVNNREIWVIPVQNPDGLIYSHTTADWRKNRRDNGDGSFGVDPNRNYGYKWGIGASSSTWSDTYKGPEAFSEPENQAIRDFAIREQFSASISYHSYGQLVLYPYSSVTDPAPDKEILKSLSESMAEFNGYDPIQSADLYPCGGDTDDWMYDTLGSFSFTFELANQFAPGEGEIDGICEKNVKAALYLLERLDNLWPVLKFDPRGSTTDNVGPYKVSAYVDQEHNPGYSVGSFTLSWRKAGESFLNDVSFSSTGGGNYEADIPGQEFGTVIEYCVSLNNEIRMPEEGFYTFSVERYMRLVVDDDGGKGYEQYYTDALQAKNLAFEVHDTGRKGTPTKAQLSAYTEVIWLTGDDSSKTLTSDEQQLLSEYLSSGGSLLISGQDIGYDIKGDAFYADFLHAKYLDDNAGVHGISGNIGDYSAAFEITGGTGASNQRYPDTLEPLGEGQAFLTYGATRSGFAASSYKGSKISEVFEGMRTNGDGKAAGILFSGDYKVIYLGFGFEGIADAGHRSLFMDACLDWLLPDTEQKLSRLFAIYTAEIDPECEPAVYKSLVGASQGLVEMIARDIETGAASVDDVMASIRSRSTPAVNSLVSRWQEVKSDSSGRAAGEALYRNISAIRELSDRIRELSASH